MLLAKSESLASATAASTLCSAIDPQLIRIVILRDAVLSELCHMSAVAIALASSKSRRPAGDDGGQSRCDYDRHDHFSSWSESEFSLLPDQSLRCGEQR